MNAKQINSFVNSLTEKEQRQMLKDMSKTSTQAKMIKAITDQMKSQEDQAKALAVQIKELSSLLAGEKGCGCGGCGGACSCSGKKGVSPGELDENHKSHDHEEEGEACPVCNSSHEEEEGKNCGLAHEISTKILELDKAHSELLKNMEASKALHKEHPEGHWCRDDCPHASHAKDLERKASLIAQQRQSLLGKLCSEVDPTHKLCENFNSDDKAMSSLDETNGGALRGEAEDKGVGRQLGSAAGGALGQAAGTRYGGAGGGKIGRAVGTAAGGAVGHAAEGYIRDRMAGKKGEKLFGSETGVAAITGGPLAALNTMKDSKPQEGEKFAAAVAPIARAVGTQLIGGAIANKLSGDPDKAMHKGNCPYCSHETEPPRCHNCGMDVKAATCETCGGSGKMQAGDPFKPLDCPRCS